MMTARLLAALLASGALALGAPPPRTLAAPCQFVLGFAALHDALPGQVGTCLEDQAFTASGDAVQHTTGGLLVWRQADNWTAFTDGYHAWVNGPRGIQRRLNTERFPWESLGGSTASTSVVVSDTTNSVTAVRGDSGGSGLGSVSTTVTGDGGTVVVRNVGVSSGTSDGAAACQRSGGLSLGHVSADGSRSYSISIGGNRGCGS